MKQKIILIGICVVLLLAVVTNPDRSKHQETITAGISDVVQEVMLSDSVSMLQTSLISYCTPKLCEFAFGPQVKVRNYLVYSIGGIPTDDGGFRKMSFGAFGFVYFPKGDLEEFMKSHFAKMKELRN